MTRKLAVALVALIGCGDNIPAIAFGDLDASRRTAECERLVRCGLFAEQATCEAYSRIFDDTALANAVDEGKVRFDAAAAKVCIDALAAASCDVTSKSSREVERICDTMLTGGIEDGGQCAFDQECTSELCNEPLCPRTTCCFGICGPRRDVSEVDGPCERDANCVEDSFCGKDQVCHTLVGTGGLCETDAQCEYGLACIGASDLQAGNCRALPSTGEPCPYLRCAEIGAICTAGQCVAVGLPGATCSVSADCSPHAYCDRTGRCADTPTLGMPCDVRCAGESACVSGTCERPVGNNQPCGADLECESGFCAEGPAFDFCADPTVCT